MKYNFGKIEKKWQLRWFKDKTYEPDFDTPTSRQGLRVSLSRTPQGKQPFYNLMMFPYPSAEGLHIGNMFAFVGSDIYGRKKRMEGCDVFEPIGLDGFGMHSENYALKIKKHPADQARISEKNFYRQLSMIGNGFAWDERLETYDAEYYRWTQWIFVQLYKAGLAYRKKASVNWCPKCLTVLADEQVIGGGCERCEAKVIKKELEQWFFKITKYADKLLEGLDNIDWSEKIKIAQRNWIGKSEGAMIKFEIRNPKSEIEIFTTRPDTLFGATYLVLSPEHKLISKLVEQIQNKGEVLKYIEKANLDVSRPSEEKTGVELKGVKAVNPANGEEIPVWVADYVLSGYGTGAIMAVPAHDERDFEFASKFKLPIKKVIAPRPIISMVRNAEDIAAGAGLELRVEAKCWVGDGELINSGEFSRMDSEKAKWEITKMVGGKRQTQYRLRDWLISRQRYWGPPIPMIWCDRCKKWMPEKEENLPVKLPYVKDFRPTGTDKSPLANFPEFYETKCPECGAVARRETDVSDTFLDSAWYYISYLARENSDFGFRISDFEARTRRWLPVDMYIGGQEHAVLHLLYVRFISMVLHDLKIVDFAAPSEALAKEGNHAYGEPITKFRAHGLLIKDGAKMSKSKGNVVNPDEYIKVYGADAFRVYLMFLGPFEEGGDFNDSGIRGAVRFLNRVWDLAQNLSEKEPDIQIKTTLHRTIKKVTEDIDNLGYNTAISALMILLNAFQRSSKKVDKESFHIFLKLLAPFAPHMTEELFEASGGQGSIHKSAWPAYDESLIRESSFTLVIQINGKLRDSVEASIGITEKEAVSLALGRPRILAQLKEASPSKIIFVPGRLVNIVLHEK